MELIGKALRKYAEVNKTLPPAYTTDKEGKPLLSWRVLILPYFEPDDGLYRQFHLDEPWDSEHNKKLIAEIPLVYRHRESKVAGEGRTNFLTVRGADTLFPGKDAEPLPNLAPNEKIILTVEVSDARAVTWTKPDDFEYSEQNPLDGLVGLRPHGFLAGFTDGSVQFFPAEFDPATLRAMFTHIGAELEH
jgi:hypothetical protein